jgi:hypothetical protein
MIEMLVCGLMMWYHVDCVNFIQYDEPLHPMDKLGYIYTGGSEIEAGIGLMTIFDKNAHDKCGMDTMSHEYQRFHQQRWDFMFCNV